METYKCQFYENSFKTASNLKYHQKSAKYCIDIQSKKSLLIDHSLKECIYCTKTFR